MLKMERHIDIDRFDYDLPDERIAKYPLEERSASKLLVYERGEISERRFRDIGDILPEGTLLVFNNTKVIRARIIMHKPSGARIEVFCLEPHDPADYERAFAVKGSCRWSCIVGNLKKWKEGPLVIDFEYEGRAERMLAWREGEGGREQIVRFEWTADLTFGQLLEHLGRIPIPPYLNRESQEIDNTRYQTVYSKVEGSVAAPTAGACGVLPAVLLPMCKYEELSQHRILEALYVASGIGAVIAYKACIAGASGGCQAEIGTASAMAAGALVALRDGTGQQIGHAVAMALKNLMGLVCDPVAGLVEGPCVKRNVIGAVNAISAADMALAGIESRIPVDEVIDAMGEVGRRMPVEFRETALGGLAATPTGRRVKQQMHPEREE